MLIGEGFDPAQAQTRAQFAYEFVETTGGLGLLAFGPICVRLESP